MLSRAFEFLELVQANDGGWGYSPAGVSIIETTAMVILTLQNSSSASPAIKRAAEWILSFQNSDGGWGFCPQDIESGWQTAWAMLALSKLGSGKEACEKGIQWLLNVEVMQIKDAELLASGKEVAQIDFSLRGWPWLPGEASWVEPTALTILALKDHLSRITVKERVEEAIRYLIDRRCAGGGWNVGNPVMFNAYLPARVTPTAMALLALAEVRPQEISSDDIRVLRAEMFRDHGTMALAWGLWALHVLGEEDAEARSILILRQLQDGSWDENPFLTALSCMALTREV